MNIQAKNRRKLFRFLGFMLGLLCFMLGTFMSLGMIYEKEVAAYFLKKLNDNLYAKIEISKVELSLLKHFPYATLRLEDVKVGHARYQAEGYLLDVEHVDLLFSVFSLWNNDYAIQKIEVANGKMQLLCNEQGKNNYDLLKTDTGAKDDSFALAINHIIAKQIDLKYQDDETGIYAQTYIETSHISGKFSDQLYQLAVTGNLNVNFFKSGSVYWLRESPLKVDFTLAVNKPEHRYSFRKGNLAVADLEVGVEGEFVSADSPAYRFLLSGKNLNINTVLSLLPETYADKINAYKSEGRFYAEAIIENPPSKGKEPSVSAKFGVQNGTVSHKASGIKLSELNLQGEFNQQVLKLNNVSMLLNNQRIKGACTISGFSNPQITLKTDALINLTDLGTFLEIKELEGLKGMVELHLDLVTRAEVFSSGKIPVNAYSGRGTLDIQNASFRLKGDTLRFQNINGHCIFNQNDLELKSFSLNAGQSDLSLSGHVQNLAGWLLKEQEYLSMNILVNANRILLDEFFQRKSQIASDNEYRLEISPRLKVNLKAKVDQLQFRKFRALNLNGAFIVENQKLKAEQLRFATMNGLVSMNGLVDASPENNLKFHCSADLKAVDIQRLFFECENFGQEVIQDKNLKGKVDADIVFSASGSKSLSINTASVECVSDITINNGELIQFEPLEVLGRYISLDELKHIRFSQLKNQIKISKRTIYIPSMDIQSSAISINASGTHNFDNEVDYHIRVRLSDILAKKAKRNKRENDEFGQEVGDGSGGFYVFLSMKGPIDNPKISYDTKGAREKRKEDIKKEKETLRELFREEFGKSRKDSARKPVKPTGKKPPAVILEFDE